MNKIILWSVTVALAGFIFGFDTVVISGADKKLQALRANWDLEAKINWYEETEGKK